MHDVTPVVLTLNEGPNIARNLTGLKWATRIVVLDSGSTDETVQLAGAFPNVEVHHRDFDSHAEQWNFGVSLVRTEWVLSLDADYVLSDNFREELLALPDNPPEDAFLAGFVYCVHGTPLRASLYPQRAVLFRREKARYVQDGHTQLLQFEGRAGKLKTPIFHDDRKPLNHWLAAQDKYALLEARHLLAQPVAQLSSQDRLRLRVYFAPIAVLFYLLLGKGLITAGWQGWFYVMQRTLAEILLSLRLIAGRENLEGEPGKL